MLNRLRGEQKFSARFLFENIPAPPAGENIAAAVRSPAGTIMLAADCVATSAETAATGVERGLDVDVELTCMEAQCECKLGRVRVPAWQNQIYRVTSIYSIQI